MRIFISSAGGFIFSLKFLWHMIDLYSRAVSPRKPCRLNCRRPGKLNLTIWNGAIYCTPVAAAPHMVSRRCTMAYKPRRGRVMGRARHSGSTGPRNAGRMSQQERIVCRQAKQSSQTLFSLKQASGIMSRASSAIPERLQFGATFIRERTQQVYRMTFDQLSEFGKSFARREKGLYNRANDHLPLSTTARLDTIRISPIRAYTLTNAEMSDSSFDRASAYSFDASLMNFF
jgi:hypothetical protein